MDQVKYEFRIKAMEFNVIETSSASSSTDISFSSLPNFFFISIFTTLEHGGLHFIFNCLWGLLWDPGDGNNMHLLGTVCAMLLSISLKWVGHHKSSNAFLSVHQVFGIGGSGGHRWWSWVLLELERSQHFQPHSPLVRIYIYP